MQEVITCPSTNNNNIFIRMSFRVIFEILYCLRNLKFRIMLPSCRLCISSIVKPNNFIEF